jgi:hypothetical protein
MTTTLFNVYGHITVRKRADGKYDTSYGSQFGSGEVKVSLFVQNNFQGAMKVE